MLKQHPKLLSYTAQVLDILTLIVAFFLAFVARDVLVVRWVPYARRVAWTGFLGLLPVNLFVWWIFLRWQGVYGPQRLMSFKALMGKIFRVALIGTLVLFGVVYLTKSIRVPRTLVLSLSAMCFLGVIIEKYLWLKFLEYLHTKGRGYSHVVIVGTTEIAQRFVDSVKFLRVNFQVFCT